ncbi:hypothetical protein FXN63_13385 [Pigmentiphaga aceris]|uniref:Uncharacterized protein n=1 Tax=Pigmentiphaga aceris TaxID=1940612 RepID=A0A5C0AW87_9BURK|nr:hypothetical protein [Pigmentiphaga aceris]QEI06712.1 hypothetical protein FXN63_13385 [Pigmentiphaga aceris]
MFIMAVFLTWPLFLAFRPGNALSANVRTKKRLLSEAEETGAVHSTRHAGIYLRTQFLLNFLR